MKKKIKFFLSLFVITTMIVATNTVAYCDDSIKVSIDGTQLQFSQPPICENDRILVPMRVIFESLGATVLWVNNTQSIIATKDNTVITMQVESPIMTVSLIQMSDATDNTKYGTIIDDTNVVLNDVKKITIDAPPKLVNDNTLVPVRAISEALGATVSWDDITSTVNISTK